MFPTRRLTLLVLAATVLGSSSDLSLDESTLDLHELARRLEPRGDLHFPLHARGTNKDKSTPTYKNAKADIESRVNDLLPRMTLDEKTAQLIQGDINGWMDMSSPFDNTLTHNATGLASMLTTRSGSIWAGYQTPWTKLAYAIKTGQDYLVNNTTLGIPAVFQSEGLHGYINNGTIFPSPLGMASSFNTDLLNQVASALGNEAEGTGVKQLFAPVLDLSRELRWGRVEENFGEDPYLTGELGHAFVTGLQVGSNSTSTPSKGTYRLSAMCKHFAAFGSPYNGLNIAPVFGGERELRSTYLPPFKRACVEGDALALMSAYSSYDGVPAMANSHLMVDILRNEWGYKHFVMGDAGDVDLLYSLHGVCPSAPLDAARECAAKTAVMRIQGEMGGGTYTYQTLADQVRAGKVDVKYIDETVKSLLRVKFKLGLFENPYPASDPYANLRTTATRKVLHQIEQEQLVLLENKGSVLPLNPKSLGSIAIIGPQSNRVSFGDYVFTNASNAGVSPLDGVKAYLSSVGSTTSVKFAQGAELWSSDTSGIAAAVDAAKSADVAVVFVGTWTLDQNNLWTPGTNATTGEHNDLSGLGLVGASMDLVKAVQGAAKKTVVVFVSGKPVAEPWIQAHADAVIQQFYPGELGGQAIAELLFGAFSPSGKLPVSFPRSVGTAPAFYNYLKGGRPIDAGAVLDDGNLKFGHSYVFDTPVPIWSFGHGLSYVNLTYSGMTLSKSTISRNADFSVSVTLKNNGAVSAKEVVQVYATDDVSSAVTPNTKLVGFVKVELAAGASQTVTVPIRNEELKLWTADSKWAVEAGTFTIRVGTSDQTYTKATLTVQ